MKREPVMIGAAVVAFLEMAILMAIQMGWIDWNTQQIASFNNFVISLVALAGLLIPLFIARSKVTPVADPRLPDDIIEQLKKE